MGGFTQTRSFSRREGPPLSSRGGGGLCCIRQQPLPHTHVRSKVYSAPAAAEKAHRPEVERRLELLFRGVCGGCCCEKHTSSSCSDRTFALKKLLHRFRGSHLSFGLLSRCCTLLGRVRPGVTEVSSTLHELHCRSSTFGVLGGGAVLCFTLTARFSPGVRVFCRRSPRLS